LNDIIGGYFLSKLRDTLLRSGSMEIWWVIPPLKDAGELEKKVLKLRGRGEAVTVYRRALGSVLAQLDEILGGDAYSRAVENTAAVLSML